MGDGVHCWLSPLCRSAVRARTRPVSRRNLPMRFTWARKKAPGSLPPPFYPARKAGSISCRRRRPARRCR
ncbi:Enoyl-[acyl-carrier-protein] reductase FMN [Qipengyuania citrea LAMA 915]|uniref:Enoyl-[acyl-carrier-protein] reductase FMN n=1 Tax=Qipengyuania citrea LAMA 915 TaxID=1306953 RepID=A0A0L1KAF3_9SPHN|nr:Enoyl-[acyl-carrier-protein] reductase FMN [Qipengyuania citrea LAMA 915]